MGYLHGSYPSSRASIDDSEVINQQQRTQDENVALGTRFHALGIQDSFRPSASAVRAPDWGRLTCESSFQDEGVELSPHNLQRDVEAQYRSFGQKENWASLENASSNNLLPTESRSPFHNKIHVHLKLDPTTIAPSIQNSPCSVDPVFQPPKPHGHPRFSGHIARIAYGREERRRSKNREAQRAFRKRRSAEMNILKQDLENKTVEYDNLECRYIMLEAKLAVSEAEFKALAYAHGSLEDKVEEMMEGFSSLIAWCA